MVAVSSTRNLRCLASFRLASEASVVSRRPRILDLCGPEIPLNKTISPIPESFVEKVYDQAALQVWTADFEIFWKRVSAGITKKISAGKDPEVVNRQIGDIRNLMLATWLESRWTILGSGGEKIVQKCG